MIELRELGVGYEPRINVISGINLRVPRGKVLAVLGQNGAGKSTLARAIMNNIPFRTGQVFKNGVDISKLQTQELIALGFGLFIQGGVIFPNMTIEENLIVATGKMKILEEDNKILNRFKHNFGNLAGELSGGEKNILALTMLLSKHPNFIVLDEPTAGLDPKATEAIYQELHAAMNGDLSLVIIEQNIHKAVYFADQIAILESGRVVDCFENVEPEESLRKVQRSFFG